MMTDDIFAEGRAAFVAELRAAEIAADERWDRLAESYAADVRKLYLLAVGRSGAGRIAGDLLRVLHRKSGAICPFDMLSLDPGNREAAMRLIECAATACFVPDAGLMFGLEGEPLLAAAEVDVLFKNTVEQDC